MGTKKINRMKEFEKFLYERRDYLKFQYRSAKAIKGRSKIVRQQADIAFGKWLEIEHTIAMFIEGEN